MTKVSEVCVRTIDSGLGRFIDWLSLIIAGLATAALGDDAYQHVGEFVHSTFGVMGPTIREAIRPHVVRWSCWSIIVTFALQFIFKYARGRHKISCDGLNRQNGLLEAANTELKEKNFQLCAANEEYKASLADTAYATLEGYLMRMSIGHLKFGTDSNGIDRITIYVFDAAADAFVPCGRYSTDPTFSDHVRKTYPFSQGFLRTAWKQFWEFKNDAPDPIRESAYKDWHKRHGVPKKTSSLFRMKSRLYGAIRIDDAAKKTPLAVLMIESTNPKRFIESGLRSILETEALNVSDFVARVRPHLGQPSIAKESGF